MLVLPAKYEDMFCETTEYVASFSTLKLIHIQSVKIKKTNKKKTAARKQQRFTEHNRLICIS